jgi:hypothetical protein
LIENFSQVKRLKAFSFGGSSKKMEKSANIEDQVMDNLLRSYIKQQKQPEINCEGFDPDLASLYLERVLTEKETARFEFHLYECSPCRNSVVTLAHFAEQEIPLALTAPVKEKQAVNTLIATESKTVEESGANWLGSLKGFFVLLLTPRYALGAVAAIVLAVSIPLVLSQRDGKTANSSDKTASEAKPTENGDSGAIAQAPSSAYYNAPGEPRSKEPSSPTTNSPANSREGTTSSASGQTGVGTGSANGGSAAATPVAEAAAEPEKKETAKSDNTTVADNKTAPEETAKKAGEPPVVASAPQPAPRVAERRDLPRIEADEALRVPKNDKDTASRTLKPGTSDGSVASASKPTGPTIRPGDASVRPPATSTDSGGRGLTDNKAKSLRAESDVRKERARASASRKVQNKTFWLIDDVWTDKDYKKDKELPMVTLTKESDVYKEVSEKHSNLQKVFNGFAANEKVIVVYKGTVYRLMP